MLARLTGQDAKNTLTGNAFATYPGATTLGNLLIAAVWSNVATNALAISGWTQATHQENGTNSVALFYKIADGTETTITATGVSTNIRINIYEYSGSANPVVLDGTNSGTSASATSITTTSITTTATDDLIIVVVAPTAATTLNSSSFSAPFTRVNESFNPVRLFVGDNTSNSPGSTSASASWTTAAASSHLIVGFQGVPPVTALPQQFNNYQFVKGGDGLSFSERIR